MPVAGIDEPRTHSDRVQNGDFGPPAGLLPTMDPFFVDQYETRGVTPRGYSPTDDREHPVTYKGYPFFRRPAPGLLAEQG